MTLFNVIDVPLCCRFYFFLFIFFFFYLGLRLLCCNRPVRVLTAEIEKRIQALEMRCYRRPLNISYKDHVTANEEVRNRIQNAVGVHDDLLTMVKKRKLR